MQLIKKCPPAQSEHVTAEYLRSIFTLKNTISITRARLQVSEEMLLDDVDGGE